MEIRTLTPSKKRELNIPDEMIGIPRYGTYVDAPRREAAQTVAPAASMRMANRTPTIPEAQRLDLPTQAKASGLRIYDRRIDAWVAPPKPPIDVDDRAPAPSIKARSEGGDAYWIVCRVTGVKMRRICAQTSASAAQIAGEYALNHGLSAADAYAMKDDAHV